MGIDHNLQGLHREDPGNGTGRPTTKELAIVNTIRERTRSPNMIPRANQNLENGFWST
jgi:hypothetical protein